MKQNYYTLFILMLVLFAACSPKDAKNTKDREIEDKIDALINKMTLEEKAGQMTQVTIDVILKTDAKNQVIEPQEIDPEKLRIAIEKYKVGSILNVANHAYSREEWFKIMSAIEAEAQKYGLKAPVLYGIDAIHGVNYTKGATLFPQQIAQAAGWNREMVEKAAAVTAYETRASYIPWTFSPVCDLGRNPVWPRFWETLGEDVFLASELSKAMVRGYQGDDVSANNKVAACLKHYVGYSFPLSGKDRTPAWIPENFLREYFLPVFKHSIDQGAWTVMVNSAEINGIPVHASKFILTEILKNELNFKGFAVSDWNDIKNLYERHKIAVNNKEAVQISVNAGIDMSMVPFDFSFTEYLIELVREGKVSESRVNDAVRRILRVKYHVGLFDKMFSKPEDYPLFGSKEHQKISYDAACEVITLLKNQNNILPLNKSAKILVTGTTANNMMSLNGGWSYNWQGTLADEYANEKHTVYESFKAIGGDKISLVDDKTFNSPEKVQEAVRAASGVDYIVLCLGELSYCETPGNIDDLTLPSGQINLAWELAKTGKPIILVLLEGRPRLINKFENQMNAIVMGYYPGNEGGDAIVSVIYGEINPSGKLPFNYPRFPNCIVPYDHKYSDEAEFMGYNPQFEFGYGLSYTTFQYSELNLDSTKKSLKDSLTISVNVTNTGKTAGKEVVQLYVSDLVASITPPVKRLRGFEKILLNPGETKTVVFKLSVKDLSFVNAKNQWVTEPGDFIVKIGNLSQNFTITNN